jgi:hypothetical protein
VSTPLVSATRDAALTLTAGLPLRQDDPVSLVFITKAMLITVILLAVTYLVLRWYARRSGVMSVSAEPTELRCVTALRLSTKTKIYLLKSDTTDVLVTESATGTTVTILPGQMPPSAGHRA